MNKTINLINYINEIYHNLMKETDNMEEIDISELHMHKILFILYGKFLSKFNIELFNANFLAWKYGPVEIDYRNKNLEKFNSISLSNEQFNFLNFILKNKLIKSNPWLLVDFTHDLSCWINNYQSKDQKITRDEIKSDFDLVYMFE